MTIRGIKNGIYRGGITIPYEKNISSSILRFVRGDKKDVLNVSFAKKIGIANSSKLRGVDYVEVEFDDGKMVRLVA